MGASTSTASVPVAASSDRREAEAIAASTGALPMLRKAFSLLSDPNTNAIPLDSLRQCFDLKLENPRCEATAVPIEFSGLLCNLGSSIVDLYFLAEKGGVSWINFLRGYAKCCTRTAASTSLNNLLRVYAVAVVKVGLPGKLQFESDDDVDGKMSGFLLPADVLMLLWMCWVLSWDSRYLSSRDIKADNHLPVVYPLVLSAVVSCGEVGGDVDWWDCDLLGLNMQLPAGKIHMWALKTVPKLADCFGQYVHAKLCNFTTLKDKVDPPCSSTHIDSSVTCNFQLLTHGRAWAISLTQRGSLSEEILEVRFPGAGDRTNECLLYRSSLHGKGLNRFWSNVEGYKGPLLLLIAASTEGARTGNRNARSWIIGALTHQGFENKDSFYGSMGSLYAISPIFHVFSSLGKEKNFVYSHLHPTGRVYEPHPKPVGIAFGGSPGNERIFIDEDFAKITVRHHAVDRTYQPGMIFPDQGFLPVEASVLEVEVWGLGGGKAKEVQDSYKKREELFTEQRRKVDLKTFASWDDSPEKMMMDMISDPNVVRREDR